MKENPAKVVAEGSGYLLLEQQTEGWSGCKFKDRETSIKVRRVDPEGDDHVQMEIKVIEYKESGATRSMRGSLTLTPEMLRKLMEHLSKPWEGIKR